MSNEIEVEMMSKVHISPAMLGKLWINLDSDSQVEFFNAAAKEATENWDRPMGLEAQCIEIGRHLLTCKCATEDARKIIYDIAYGMEDWTP